MIQPVSDGAFKHRYQGMGGSMVLWYEFETSERFYHDFNCYGKRASGA